MFPAHLSQYARTTTAEWKPKNALKVITTQLCSKLPSPFKDTGKNKKKRKTTIHCPQQHS